MLPVDDEDRLRRDLLQIHQLIEAKAPMTVEQRIQPGRRVRIKSGAMKGVEGLVIERRGGDRLLVVVDYIQQGVSMAIEDFKVEPI
jgi:transcription antitermination factor NusG